MRSTLFSRKHYLNRARTCGRGLALVALLGAVLGAQAQTTSPFACASGKSYIFQSDATTGVEVDLSTGKAGTTSAPILSSGNQKLNAFGYNKQDNYIWAVRLGSNQLVQVGSDFKANVFGVDGLSGEGANAVVGDVSPAGIMYITRGGSTGGNATDNTNQALTIYSIDLTQKLTAAHSNYTATQFATIPAATSTSKSYINDWAVSPQDGHLYALYATINVSSSNPGALTLYRFLTSAAQATDGSIIPAGTRQTLGTVVPEHSPATATDIKSANYASSFMDAAGNYYVVASDNGYTYRINTPHTAPYSLTSQANLTGYYIGTGPMGGANNDGARCPAAAISTAAPLPVQLSAFSASAAPNRAVQLAWQTASELNNSYFEVQRSQDGRTFTAIGRVAGHSSSTQASAYSFTDAAPGAEATQYYRLRQVNTDGSFDYSPVRVATLAAGSSPALLSVAPNPTTAAELRLQVQYGGPASTAAVLTVQGLAGQRVLTQAVTLQPGANTFTSPAPLLPGAYWLSLRGDATLGVQGAKVLITN